MSRQPLVPLLLVAGCKLEAAPETLDELFHRVWGAFPVDSGQDFDLLVGSVPDVVDVDALVEKHLEGQQTRLTAEQIAELRFLDADGGPADPPDPSTATPMYVVDRFPCTGEALEEILAYPDQNALYNTYDAYERRYDEPREGFLDGDTDFLGWEGSIEVKEIIGHYFYDFRTELRRIPLNAETGVPGDTVWMTRNHMLTPARWETNNRSFPQDYQVELWVPVAGGDFVHLYPVWREMDLGDLGNLEEPIPASINIGQTLKWDRRTAELCAEGVPPIE